MRLNTIQKLGATPRNYGHLINETLTNYKGVAKQLFPYIVPHAKFESTQNVASILVDIRSNLAVSNMPKTTNSFGGAFSPFLRSGQEH